jgi:hypothetical protein
VIAFPTGEDPRAGSGGLPEPCKRLPTPAKRAFNIRGLWRIVLPPNCA